MTKIPSSKKVVVPQPQTNSEVKVAQAPKTIETIESGGIDAEKSELLSPDGFGPSEATVNVPHPGASRNVGILNRLAAAQGPIKDFDVLAPKLQDPGSLEKAMPVIERMRALLANISDVDSSSVHAADYQGRTAEDKARAVWSKLHEGIYDLSDDLAESFAVAKREAQVMMVEGGADPSKLDVEEVADLAKAKLEAEGLRSGCPFRGGVAPEVGSKGILGDGLKSLARVLHLRDMQRTFDDGSDFVEAHDKLLHTNGGTVMYVRVPSENTSHDYT